MIARKIIIETGLVLVVGTSLALIGGAGSGLAQPVQGFSPPDCVEVEADDGNDDVNGCDG